MSCSTNAAAEISGRLSTGWIPADGAAGNLDGTKEHGRLAVGLPDNGSSSYGTMRLGSSGPR
ncbi:hypothetical protein SNK04_014185 [Fusarium graminearum]